MSWNSIDWINTTFFYLMACAVLLGAAVTVFAPRIVYNTIALVVTFLSVAGVFVLLNADFLAVSQIIIYGVGITILLIFAIMLTGKEQDKKLWIAFAFRTLVALGCAGMIFLVVVFGITDSFRGLSDKSGIFAIQPPSVQTIEMLKKEGTTKTIGTTLLTNYVLPFELLSLLLLGSVIGAAVIARKNEDDLCNEVEGC